MRWRLITSRPNDAFRNMALDEALLECYSVPVLRLYTWKPSAISIGYFQSLDDEVDTAECRRQGIDFVRRITGGGAVFHESELTYSFICQESLVDKDILSSYKRICGALIIGLRKLGLNASFSPINDILVAGRKISGSAQTRRRGVLLQHGTILLDVDVERMFSLLKVPKEKISGKLISDAKQRVISVRQLVALPDLQPLHQAIIEGFGQAFNIGFSKDMPTSAEIERSNVLENKFRDPEWNARA